MWQVLRPKRLSEETRSNAPSWSWKSTKSPERGATMRWNAFERCPSAGEFLFVRRSWHEFFPKGRHESDFEDLSALGQCQQWSIPKHWNFWTNAAMYRKYFSWKFEGASDPVNSPLKIDCASGASGSWIFNGLQICKVSGYDLKFEIKSFQTTLWKHFQMSSNWASWLLALGSWCPNVSICSSLTTFFTHHNAPFCPFSETVALFEDSNGSRNILIRFF